ncbi:MAG: hypothetical protein DI603_16595 [Roseateles depolymerans]|uniref:Uncharacterized protein n=1 Tax=Roseateles depolymerans TaxID=76731 RepID=A0A2W5FJI6_9BURK|nr:MAG: hypothetical protein DI603_16595 [Roseateles depolymerans]
MKALLALCFGALMTLQALPAHAQAKNRCGVLAMPNMYGPFDYRSANAGRRDLVESKHFDDGVAALTRRLTGPFGGDIGYTLMVFPNHPHALLTMERLVEVEKQNPPEDSKYTIECWYERALRYAPDDHIPRLLYANFLIKKQKLGEAREQLDYVAKNTEDNPFAQFNTGMLYMDIKDYDKALTMAHHVIALGIDRPDLRDRLVAAGRWVDPPAGAASAPEAAASAAPAPSTAASAPATGASSTGR